MSKKKMVSGSAAAGTVPSQKKRSNSKKKKNSTLSVILIVLVVILAGVFLVCGYKVYSTLHGYKVADDMYNNLSGTYVSAPKKPDKPAAESEEEDNLDPEISPVDIDFDALLEECPDVVGWLYSMDTPINYPVVQAEDNEKYLHTFIDGTYNSSGTLFIDSLCEPDFSSTNTVLYGHHMNDGSMLASICKYGSQDYYNAHPVMYLNTPEQNYRIELFSGYITDPGAVSYIIEFNDEYTRDDFINEVRSLSDFQSSVEINPEDKLITFSTCTYEYYDARYVVHGKLVPIH